MCACSDRRSRAALYYLNEEGGLVCLECKRHFGHRDSPEAKARLASGARLYLTEEVNPVPAAGAGGLTPEQLRQRRLLRLPGSDVKGGSAMDLQALQRTRPDLVKVLGEDIPLVSVLGRGLGPLDEALENHSFSEITRGVSQAVRERFASTHSDAFVREIFVGKAIIEAGGKLFEVPYELDDATGEVSLGKATEVRIRYVQVGAQGQAEEAVKEVLVQALAGPALTEEQKRERRLAGLPG